MKDVFEEMGGVVMMAILSTVFLGAFALLLSVYRTEVLQFFVNLGV